MKNNPADAIKDTMWRFLMTGNQKGNPQLLKEYVYDLVQMMTQKTAGQRGNKKDISYRELEALEWSIVIEATCLVLSGQIDKLIEDKGENYEPDDKNKINDITVTYDLDQKKDAEEKQ